MMVIEVALIRGGVISVKGRVKHRRRVGEGGGYSFPFPDSPILYVPISITEGSICFDL